jgi:transcription termination factor NusB
MYNHYQSLPQPKNKQAEAIDQLKECYQNAVRESEKCQAVAKTYQVWGEPDLESQYKQSAEYHRTIAQGVLSQIKNLDSDLDLSFNEQSCLSFNPLIVTDSSAIKSKLLAKFD